MGTRLLPEWLSLSLFGGSLAVYVGSVLGAPRRAPQAEETEGFDVALSIRDARGIETGRDWGLLIFCDGWLVFEGCRTSFAISKDEALLKTGNPGPTLRLEDLRSVVLGCRVEDQRASLDRAFERWSSGASPQGDAVLPPTEVHPAVHADRGRLFAFGGMFLATGGAWALAGGLWPLTLVAGLLAVASFNMAGRSLRQLRASLPQLSSAPERAALDDRNGDSRPLPPVR